MGNSYPDRTNATGVWKVNEISKDKISNGNWPGNFGTPGGRGMFAGGLAPGEVDTVDFITITAFGLIWMILLITKSTELVSK